MIDETTMDRIKRSNMEAIFGDLKCCNETPVLIFRPAIDVLKYLPSLSISCRACRKEKTMHLYETITMEYDDPVFSESIEILINKWNEDEQMANTSRQR